MNCFNHRERPALGLCKSCMKALCEDCLTETPRGLACRGKCGDRVELVDRMIDNNIKIIDTTNIHQKSNTTFFILFGLFAIAMAGFLWWRGGRLDPFVIFLFSIGVLYGGFGVYRRGFRFKFPNVG